MNRLARHPAARLAFSLVLVAFVLWLVDPLRVLAPLAQLSIAFVVLACAYYAGCQLVSSWRWRLFLTAKGIDVPLARLFSYYMIGMFLNLFLPGAVGGDAAKSYYVYRDCRQGHYAIASVFLERFTGLIGLTLLSFAALLVHPPGAGEPLVLAAVGGSALFLLAVVLAIWWPPLARLLGKSLPKTVRKFHEALAGYRRHPGTLARAVAASIVIQALYVLFYALVAWGLGVDIDARYFLLFLAPVTLVMMLPFSFGGLGVREAAFALLFTQVGVAPADAIAVSLTVHLLGILLSLGGGVLLLTPRAVSQ